MVKHVVKRDGRVVIFDNRKIVDAILKAMGVTEEGEDIVLEVVCPDTVECEIELELGWFFKDTKKLWEKTGTGTYVIGTK